MSTYSTEFQNSMVQKLLMPNGPSVSELAKETNISKSCLYKWLKQAKSTSNSSAFSKNNKTVEFKLNALIETANMNEEQIGIYCRKHGIFSHNLNEWRNLIIATSNNTIAKEIRTENSKLKNQNKLLRSEIKRKDKALAEAAALLVLKKKADLIWGKDEDDI